MTSEARIKTNRENAQRSTGPRTPEGKAASSRNGFKHGLCAETHFIGDDDPAEFQLPLDDLYTPATDPAATSHQPPATGAHPTVPSLLLKLLAVLILLPALSRAQCTLLNQATCSAVYTGAANPTLSAFLANVESSFQAINASIANKPQPKITVTAQILPASGSWLSSSVQVFGPAINGYMDLLKNSAGVTTQDVNFWPATLSAASQYAPGSGDITIPSDCAGGVKIATNASAPAGTSHTSHCAALTYYDSMFSHAATTGVTLRVGFFPTGDIISACGLTPGSISESQYEHCLIPLIKAAMTRWGSAITAVQVLEEPLAGMAAVQIFSISDTGTFIRDSSAAVKAIVPGTPVGAAATGVSWPSLDTAYWTDWTTGNVSGAGTPAALDFLVIDLFSGTCDQSGNQYYNTTVWFQAHFLGANAHGKPVRVGQSDHPLWCPIGGLATQPNAYLGANDVIWQTSGMQVAWQDTIIKWASTVGIQSFAMYCTLPMFAYTSNQSNDNCTSGAFSAQAMSRLSPTDAAASYKMLAQGSRESIEGRAHTTGRVRITH